MIPDLPRNISDVDAIDFYEKLAGNLQDQSSIHVNWHTHRQNPSVCWICDLNIIVSKILFYTKSSLDMETSSSSENDSDSEIESDFNEPEYDVLDEECLDDELESGDSA